MACVVIAQKPAVKIEGVSVFKLGDSVSVINTYGYDFTEVFVPVDFDYSDKIDRLERGLNFCNDSRVFYAPDVKISDFGFRECVLTYYKNKLVDINLADPVEDGKLKDLITEKYGKSFGKIYLKGYQVEVNKFKAAGEKITPATQKLLEDNYLASIYWKDETNIVSVGGSNSMYEYDFVNQRPVDVNMGRMGLSVTNFKLYQQMIQCSNKDYIVKLAAYKKKLKDKAGAF